MFTTPVRSPNRPHMAASTSGVDCRSSLVNLRPVIVILQFDDEVALAYLLIVGDVNRAYGASHLGAQRCQVAANVRIVGDLFELATFPRIPVPGEGHQHGRGEQHHQNRRQVGPPSRPAARRSGRRIDVSWR